MTFLLFLVSLAVLEYIVRRPKETPQTGWQALAKQRAADRPADSAPALTPGLLALGQALDQFGRGNRLPRQRPRKYPILKRIEYDT
jgi:hypothetical protein